MTRQVTRLRKIKQIGLERLMGLLELERLMGLLALALFGPIENSLYVMFSLIV